VPQRPVLAVADCVVIGAGVSGLACAGALAAAGRAVVVLERARGVGGRCATRRLPGPPVQPVDFGVAFLHGRGERFRSLLREVPAASLPGWPRRVSGEGTPCHPAAFEPGDTRLAFAEGVSALPRHLARGLDVRLGAKVLGLEPAGDRVRVVVEDGASVESAVAVVATAPEEASALLATAPAEAPVRSAVAVLALTPSERCLTLLARYGPGAPAPEWDVCYPEGSRVIQLVSHDSAKRLAGREPGAPTLVIQAHPGWSRRNEDAPGWPAGLLAEAARLLGDWAARPELVQAHAWRHARTPRAGELAAPMLLTLAGGARLGLCGDRFGPGGGVEAAVVSGWKLAERILSEAGRPTSSTKER